MKSVIKEEAARELEFEIDRPTDKTNDLLDQIAFPKEIYLQYQEDIDGFYHIRISKRFRDRTEVCSVNYHPSAPVDELLKWISGALRKLHKHEL